MQFARHGSPNEHGPQVSWSLGLVGLPEASNYLYYEVSKSSTRIVSHNARESKGFGVSLENDGYMFREVVG
jgi:hypothetical protein